MVDIIILIFMEFKIDGQSENIEMTEGITEEDKIESVQDVSTYYNLKIRFFLNNVKKYNKKLVVRQIH